MTVPDKFLIFGARGRVGSELISALPPDVPLRAADIASGEYPAHVEQVRVDLNHGVKDWEQLFAGITGMFLLWPPGVRVQRVYPSLLEAAESRGVRQVVFLSILGADKLRMVPHRAIEKLLLESGMDWVFLRSAYFMQNLSGIHAQEIREQNEIFLPAGRGKLGLVDVRDLAAVASRALLEGFQNQVLEITGPQALDFYQAADIFSRVLGRPIYYRDPAVPSFFLRMRRRAVPVGLVVFMILEYLATKLGKSGQVTNQVERILNRPATPLELFVGDYAPVWNSE